MKAPRGKLHSNIGRTRPQYGHGLFQNQQQPDNTFEVRATDGKFVFLNRIQIVSGSCLPAM